jgi:hypothetical protein
MDFPKHQRPNASRLETFRSEIEAMRGNLWPYDRIAGWLRDTHRLEVSKEAIRQFCNLRKIGKGEAFQTDDKARSSDARFSSVTPRTISSPQHAEPEKKFHFDASRPIETRKNQQ